MTWRQYEKEILKYFQETFPETTFFFDKKIIGRFSKVERQIDILIVGEVAGFEIKIVVDCKYFSKNIDVKEVESFSAMVEDVEAHQGILISYKGYSKAAINRAYYGNSKIELDIVNFDQLQKFQSLVAFPYSGHFSIILPAPFGWVLDLKDKINSFASIHQRGVTLKQAQKRNEWMYIDLIDIKSTNLDLDSLIEIQNENLLTIDQNADFSYNSTVKRKDGLKTKIRIAGIKTYPAIEVTGLIQFEEYIFFIVLFTPKELLSKNLKKLQYLLTVAKAIEIDFDNNKVITQLLGEIAKTDDNRKRSDGYYQIGIWYQEMDDFENALINYKKAIECFPTHYEYLKGIIGKSLNFGNVDASKKYTIQFFEAAPNNPRVPNDLIKIFLIHNRPDILVQLFNELISRNDSDETLGNLNFHLGSLHLQIGNDSEGQRCLNFAKSHFEKVFPPDHYVFKAFT